MPKIRVGILFGGRSAEHEVSLQSAKSIVDAIDKEKYEVVLIGIDKAGRWLLGDASHFLLNETNPKLIKLNTAETELAVLPYSSEKKVIAVDSRSDIGTLDVVFPILHGPFGEDGTVQGLLKLANIPFVGAGVLGSAVGMDKDVMKRLLRDAGIPIANFITITHDTRISFEGVKNRLGLPFFIKPANLGSSVGVSKVHNESEYKSAVYECFHYDKKILIEEFIEGREIECSVLGNENPIASLAGEIVPKHEFYDYDAKYIESDGAELLIPADLPDDVLKQVQELAIKTFSTLCCEGMARIDFFLQKDGKLFVNEINTIPGFTKISMYPKLWEKSGIPYAGLIDRLLRLAIDRHRRDSSLKSSRHE